ncbi:uncharacterized protein TNCT_428042 [Trichonephila clavata]|uniref:Uncharacterized protein n=1 Tax=Trichonephila clavata TaxID=2740835 RepID=A0A8X6KMQ0_TRICU|nr:uncharacterized protein TNCT_428042 [Trichonephila clavata]
MVVKPLKLVRLALVFVLKCQPSKCFSVQRDEESDEETTDTSALLYLPISPEIDDPEEGWGPGEMGEEVQSKRQSSDQNSSKKKRTKIIDMILENAPKDETHPLLSTKSKDKVNQQAKKTGKSRQHRGSSHSESKTTHRSKHGNKKEKMSIDYYGWKDGVD